MYAGIVEDLVAAAAAAAPAAVVYAVPGSPLWPNARSSCCGRTTGSTSRSLPALSFLDLAWAALGIDPLAAGVRLVDAAAFGGVAGRAGPFLVAQCWSRQVLSDVKLAPDDVGRRRPARCSCTISGSTTRWSPRSTGGSSTGPWSPTT